MVIVITGILAGMVAVFIKSPMDSYFDMGRRADLTDTADTTVRRVARDIRLALPNSARNPTDGSDLCVEFIPTKSGGRYRAAPTSTGAGDILDLTLSVTPFDDAFDMLWSNALLPASSRIAAGDIVAVYNDGYWGNAYTGSNAIKVISVCEPTELPDPPNPACPNTPPKSTKITFVDTATGAPFERKQIPAESPSWRFQVIPSAEHVVAYRCEGVGTAGGNGTGVLRRYGRTLSGAWNQPATCADMTGSATAATMMENVSSCSLKYEQPGSGTGLSRSGILSISLEITQRGEPVRLYHQVQVSNTP